MTEEKKQLFHDLMTLDKAILVSKTEILREIQKLYSE